MRDALELFKDIRLRGVTLLLSDITLPDGSGLDLAEELQKSSAGELKAILFSGYTDYKTESPEDTRTGLRVYRKTIRDSGAILKAVKEKIKAPSYKGERAP